MVVGLTFYQVAGGRLIPLHFGLQIPAGLRGAFVRQQRVKFLFGYLRDQSVEEENLTYYEGGLNLFSG